MSGNLSCSAMVAFLVCCGLLDASWGGTCTPSIYAPRHLPNECSVQFELQRKPFAA